ncbi:conserved exported hypothetical protein [Flavobacterium sp. 9AF]|uniref:DUF2202 domain-containing protein n=1 Tax=Flavobacterium sp. 9AF TaxID=2653142 RepID=UPI0012EEFD9A|nr:DUF2202 domain-containing protein [Flavobacterium sp. 9AF]VXB52612.1 conserved exported hypothetical protein [Flavobacterium sp. 9AF]
MKNTFKLILLGIFLLSLTYISCQNNSEVTGLSQEEINQMKFMLEEEKMAFDIYSFLGNNWDLQIFRNIKESEAKHMEAVKRLLERNEITYEISSQSGVFINQELQHLYNDLIQKGSNSIIQALEVGKNIEEKDIDDLQMAISKTNNVYAKEIYTNLLNASYNHLGAFNRNLSRY